jgi:hypothetical protein
MSLMPHIPPRVVGTGRFFLARLYLLGFLVAKWFFDAAGSARLWSFASALTKLLGTKLLKGHKAPMARRS